MPYPIHAETRLARKPAPGRPVDWSRVLTDACRFIERGDADATLAALAQRTGVSRFELQRQFRNRLGASPKAYAQALKLHRLTRHIGDGRSTLAATLDAGFASSAAAYATAGPALGVAPGRLQKALSVGWWLGLSELGWMLLAATPRGICWLSFGAQPEDMLEQLRCAFPKATLANDEQRLRGWFDRAREFVLLPREALDLPLDIQGTAFQSRVWRALRTIPIGATASYAEVAARIGAPTAARAVAGACAQNKLALLIPCHRVVGAGGRLSGYRWGVDRKAALLAREAAVGKS